MEGVKGVTSAPAAEQAAADEHPHSFVSSIISTENEAVIGRVLKQLDTWGTPIAGVAQAIPILNTAYAAYEAIILARMCIDQLEKHAPGMEKTVVDEWHKLRGDRLEAAAAAGLAPPVTTSSKATVSMAHAPGPIPAELLH